MINFKMNEMFFTMTASEFNQFIERLKEFKQVDVSFNDSENIFLVETIKH